MTDQQILEAIEQCKSHCEILEETDYHSISLRGVLYTLGYTPNQADSVIRNVASRGFEYCLDPMIECNSGIPDDLPNTRIHPPPFATFWGPDQLRSRLNSLRTSPH